MNIRSFPEDRHFTILSPMERHVLFKCPHTGMNVQHWLAEAEPHAVYESVVCKACTRIHFINRATGRLLGEDDDRPGRP